MHGTWFGRCSRLQECPLPRVRPLLSVHALSHVGGLIFRRKAFLHAKDKEGRKEGRKAFYASAAIACMHGMGTSTWCLTLAAYLETEYDSKGWSARRLQLNRVKNIRIVTQIVQTPCNRAEFIRRCQVLRARPTDHPTSKRILTTANGTRTTMDHVCHNCMGVCRRRERREGG